jgi:hypothetical protein
MKDRKLPAVKLSSRTLIKTEALQAWLSAGVEGKK